MLLSTFLVATLIQQHIKHSLLRPMHSRGLCFRCIGHLMVNPKWTWQQTHPPFHVARASSPSTYKQEKKLAVTLSSSPFIYALTFSLSTCRYSSCYASRRFSFICPAHMNGCRKHAWLLAAVSLFVDPTPTCMHAGTNVPQPQAPDEP